MNASDYAAWWGAIVGTTALLWEIIKHIRSGPKLKTRIRLELDYWPPQVIVFTTNIGDAPATIEAVRPRLFQKRFPFRRIEIDVKGKFGLWGQNGLPALTLEPGEPWEVGVGPFPSARIPTVSKNNIRFVIEIIESHRNRPHRYHVPESARFFERIAEKQSQPGFEGWH